MFAGHFPRPRILVPMVVSLCIQTKVATNLFLHGAGCAKPVRQRNMDIVCVVSRLSDKVGDTQRGIERSHGRERCGCDGEGGCG